MSKIRYILTDVDGVLTDGRFYLDIHGNETKAICYRDLDAIGVGRSSGLDFAFATGEQGKMVEVLARRFNITKVYQNAKDKKEALEAFCCEMAISLDEVVYIGDSDRDAPALAAASISFAPCDATEKALQSAKYITKSSGGTGVLLEVVNMLIEGKHFAK